MEGIFIGVLCLSGCLTFSTCLLHQYHFVSDAMAWTEAQSYCREKYTDLATIENTEEMKKLKDTVSDAGHSSEVWIGLYSHIDWKWSDGFNQSGAEYRNWHQSDPNYFKANELCVVQLKSGKWYDIDCHRKRTFVCYNGTLEDSDFVPVNTAKNWTEAQRHCRENYTDLVTVRNKADINKIKNKMRDLVKPRGWAWIGLYRDPQIYWSDGSNYSFSSWYQGNKTLVNKNVGCGVADNGGKWRFISCEHPKPFVCYNGTLEDSDFVLVNTAKNWTEAQRHCRENYTDLVTVRNRADINKIQNLSKPVRWAWIGLYRDPQMYWSDGSNYSFSSWSQGNKTLVNKNVGCGVADNGGKWRFISCEHPKPFVCYRGTIEDSDFVLVNTAKNWTEAQRHCREHYTDLATVRNDTDDDKIQNLKKPVKWAWIGLYRDPQIYWSDGSNYSFSSWSQGGNRLDSMKVICGVADLKKGGKWRLISCKKTKPFVCYSMRGWCFLE